MTAENRHLTQLTDDEVVQLFRDFFGREVDIRRIAFDRRTLEEIEAAYANQSETIAIERGERHGHQVLALDRAKGLDGGTGMVLAIDIDAVRLWTFFK